MKAKRVWIATHKTQPCNREVLFVEPIDSWTTIYSDTQEGDDCYAEYKEYILIEIELEG